MTTTTKPPPPRSSPPPPSRRVSVRKPSRIPPTILLTAVEKWGKTTLAAHAPSPLILMAKGETGYDTLLSTGQVPAVPAEVCEHWVDLVAWQTSLLSDPQGIETLIFDAAGGFEAMCAAMVCERDFKGDWGETGFAAYGRGTKLVANEWRAFLMRIEQLRDKHGVQHIILGHSKIKLFNNPAGVNYDRYVCDMSDAVYQLTARQCDAILFGTFAQLVDKAKTESKKNAAEAKGKVVGTAMRTIITQRQDGYDAGNRYGMPAEIDLDCDGAEMYNKVWSYINKESA
jgi:hypothetical protein